MSTKPNSVKELQALAKKRALRGTLIPLFIIGAIGMMSEKTFYNYQHGPFKMTGDQLDKLKNADNLRNDYVTVDGTKESIDSGYQSIRIKKRRYSDEEKSRTVEASYMLLPVDRKILVVKSPSTDPKKTYKGTIGSLSSELKDKIGDELEQLQPGLKDRIYPELLSEDNSYGSLLSMGAFFAALMLIPIGIALWKTKQWSSETHETPFAKKLAEYGNARDLISTIDGEFVQMGPSGTGNGVAAVLKNWVIFMEDSNLIPKKLSDIVWVYRATSKQKDSLMVKFKNKGSLEVKAGAKAINQVIDLIAERAPWIEAGYTGKRDIAWQSRKDEFIRNVEEREKELRM